VYFIQFEFSETGDNNSYVFAHPIAAAQFFFSLVGDVGGENNNLPFVGHNDGVLVLGVAVVAVAIWVVIAYGLSRNEEAGYPIGVALVCFGLLFAATITLGRTSWGLWAAGASRYTTFDLLLLIGCYLAVLDRSATPTKAGAWNEGAEHAVSAGVNEEIDQSKVPTRVRRWDDFALPFIRAILLLAIILQIVLGTDNGLTFARGWKHSLLVAGDVTVNIDKASDDLVKNTLFVGAADVGFIRQSAQIAKDRHLSLFATHYAGVGLLTELTDVRTRMLNPANGATLRGTCLLDAVASDMSGVTKVEYRLTDSATGRNALIGVGKPTLYGWVASWNTVGTANGAYEVRSVAYGYGGKTSYSPAVGVQISNP
jgi:branched-subunit amino acid transport protein